MKGSVEIKIGGELRPLKFGTNQTIKFCQAQGITLNELDECYKGMATGNMDGSTVRNLLWSALDDGARAKGIERKFDVETVGDWMDDCPPAEMKKAFTTLKESMPNEKRGSKKKSQKVA